MARNAAPNIKAKVNTAAGSSWYLFVGPGSSAAAVAVTHGMAHAHSCSIGHIHVQVLRAAAMGHLAIMRAHVWPAQDTDSSVFMPLAVLAVHNCTSHMPGAHHACHPTTQQCSSCMHGSQNRTGRQKAPTNRSMTAGWPQCAAPGGSRGSCRCDPGTAAARR